VSNLLSVSTEVEHPNFVNPPKAKLKQGEERTPSNERFQERALETRWPNASRSLQT